jgi:D-lactate dehydrogenase
LQGFDLKGKTIGVVGLGNIGRHVARIANGFEMKVIAFDVFANKKLEKRLGVKFVGFDYLLANSDVITLHVPYNKQTHHLINKKNIGKIKRGAVLINTARGALIETSALLKALDSGILSAVGLDVLEEEMLIKEEKQLLSSKLPKKHRLEVVLQNHILLGKENVLITPHNAFNSIEAIERIAKTTMENIQKFLKN